MFLSNDLLLNLVEIDILIYIKSEEVSGPAASPVISNTADSPFNCSVESTVTGF